MSLLYWLQNILGKVSYYLPHKTLSSFVFQSLSCADSLPPHKLQHARIPCPSQPPRICSNSCPLSRWCHPTISSSRPLPLPPSIFPSIRVLEMSRLFTSSGQSTGASASASVLPMYIQDWFPLGLTGLILYSKGLSRVFSNTTVKIQDTGPRELRYISKEWFQ